MTPNPLVLLLPAGLWIGLLIWMRSLRKGDSVGDTILRISAIVTLSAAFILLALLAMRGEP
jgi:hypothetical protein